MHDHLNEIQELLHETLCFEKDGSKNGKKNIGNTMIYVNCTKY